MLRPKRAHKVVTSIAVPTVYRVREMKGIFMKKKNRKTSVAPPKMMPDFLGLRHSRRSSTAQRRDVEPFWLTRAGDTTGQKQTRQQNHGEQTQL